MNDKAKDELMLEGWEKTPLYDTSYLNFSAGFDAGYAAAKVLPQDAVLFCPKCHIQHIDKAEPDNCERCGHCKGNHFDPDNTLGVNDDGCAECEAAGAFEPCQGFVAWLNPPHKKHRCHNCNEVFKPLLIPTNGVESL